jgi:hypothetical protein
MKKKLFDFLVIALILLHGCRNIGVNKITTIDITGNWQAKEGFLPYIQTREPALKSGELKIFTQELNLPKGNYSILFEYEQLYDKSNGAALDNKFENFNGFSINGVDNRLDFYPDAADKNIFRAESKIHIAETEKPIKLKLAIHNSRVLRTLLKGSSFPTGFFLLLALQVKRKSIY